MKLRIVGDYLSKRVPNVFAHEDGCIYVGNLECAFSDDTFITGKAYTSVLPRSDMKHIGAAGFSALSLANNHVLDAGDFSRTYADLQTAYPGIQFFGTVGRPYAVLGEDRDVVVIGCLEPCRSRGSRILKQEEVLSLVGELRRTMPSTMIIVYPHWGKEGEYTRYPSPWQQKLARRWIDAGADAVVGGHSHVPQGFEYYKDKPIYYSLGNYDFEHPESRLYEGTSDRMIVEFEDGKWRELYSSDEVRAAVKNASNELKDLTFWKWARKFHVFTCFRMIKTKFLGMKCLTCIIN